MGGVWGWGGGVWGRREGFGDGGSGIAGGSLRRFRILSIVFEIPEKTYQHIIFKMKIELLQCLQDHFTRLPDLIRPNFEMLNLSIFEDISENLDVRLFENISNFDFSYFSIFGSY